MILRILVYVWSYVVMISEVNGLPTLNILGNIDAPDNEHLLEKHLDCSRLLLTNDTGFMKDQYFWNLSYAPYNTPCPSRVLVRTANQV